MDLWVVAAAAGAGYLAKYWQNLSREREGLSESFSGGSSYEKPESQPLLQQLRDKSCSLGRMARRQLGEDVSSGREQVSEGAFSEMARFGGSTTEKATTSGSDGEAFMNLGKGNDFNVFSLSNLPPGFSRNKNSQENGDKIKGKSEFGDNSGDLLTIDSTGEMDSFHQSTRNRSSLRIKRSHGYSVKSLSSLESCLIAQLHREHAEMEEYVLSSLPSPSTPIVRPLFVTDGSRIISKASSDSFSARLERRENKLQKEDKVSSDETVLGVPPLPKIGSTELPRKLKQKRGRLGRLSSSSIRVSGQHFHSQESPNGMLLFCLGITIGVMSTVVANKREVDKLNDLLKQTENLVQDLQEELEMKDSLTVKELANEGYELQETSDRSFHNRESNAFFPELELDETTECDNKEPDGQKAENSESMSKIEAELEAELERLELNMNASSLERRLSGFVEIDPDFVAIVQEELKADVVKKRAGGQADSDQDASGTSTTHTHTANYAVSPQELSLRLHEVIQSRLEERIMELETALQHSQKKVHFMESEHMNLQRRNFSNSEIGSSSTQQSPTIIEEGNSIAQPLVLNLSGEALDAYNETYEEFMRVTEMEEDPPSRVYNRNQNEKEEIHPFDRTLFRSRNGGSNGSISHLQILEERRSRNSVPDKIRSWEERSTSWSRGSNEVGECEDEDDDDDEMAKLLIEQIVEKTRRGSVALNTQRMLFSMDEI